MKINTNPDTKLSSFGYVSEGIYQMRVKDVEMKDGANYPYLKWTFEFTDPNIKCVKPEDTTVGNIIENTTLKPDAQFALRGLVEACGKVWNTELDTDELKGCTFMAGVGIKEYNGKFSNEVTKYVK